MYAGLKCLAETLRHPPYARCWREVIKQHVFRMRFDSCL